MEVRHYAQLGGRSMRQTMQPQYTLEMSLRTYTSIASHDAPLRRIAALTDLGILEGFPAEILLDLLSHFPVKTLLRFRLCNRKSLHAVWALRDFEAVAHHAGDVVRAMFLTKTDETIPFNGLCQALFESKCAYCNAFGGYLSFLGCKRVCLPCIRSHKDISLIDFATAKREFGLSHHDVKSLRPMETVRGNYTFHHTELAAGHKVVSEGAARERGIAKHRGEEEMDLAAAQIWANQASKAEIRLKTNPRARRPVPRNSIKDRGAENPYRYAGVIRMPHLDRATLAVDHGVLCRRCELVRGTDHTMYDAASFEIHAQECDQKRLLMNPVEEEIVVDGV